jgi:hypothetical protein
MLALKVILSQLFCTLLHALLPCVALYRLHFELFYPTPYQASAKCKMRCMKRTDGNVAVLSISSYFNAAPEIPGANNALQGAQGRIK